MSDQIIVNGVEDLMGGKEPYRPTIDHISAKPKIYSEPQRRLENIIDKASRILRHTEALKRCILNEDLTPYNDIAMRAALDSEYLAKHLRTMVCDTVGVPRVDYFKSHAAQALGVFVNRDNEGVIKITLPSLLPKRKLLGAHFITDPLFEILGAFVKENHVERFEKCTICVNHIYDKKLGMEGRVRDYDNIELKKIIDIINLFLLTDDSGEWCNFYHTSALGEEDETHIYIMKNEQFLDWIRQQLIP